MVLLNLSMHINLLLHVYVYLQQQLFEAKECLQAASRLSEQLEKKDEQIERLDEEGNHF